MYFVYFNIYFTFLNYQGRYYRKSLNLVNFKFHIACLLGFNSHNVCRIIAKHYETDTMQNTKRCAGMVKEV